MSAQPTREPLTSALMRAKVALADCIGAAPAVARAFHSEWLLRHNYEDLSEADHIELDDYARDIREHTLASARARRDTERPAPRPAPPVRTSGALQLDQEIARARRRDEALALERFREDLRITLDTAVQAARTFWQGRGRPLEDLPYLQWANPIPRPFDLREVDSGSSRPWSSGGGW